MRDDAPDAVTRPRHRRRRSDVTPPDGIDAAIDAALVRALSPGAGARAIRDGRRLARLFADLGRPQPADKAREIEALIWALWTNHADPALDAAMAEALDALVRRRHAEARRVLDDLVVAAPEWSEAWNKRATLAFVEERDLDSLADIARTFEFEPRHFGAAASLGQICLRQDRRREALAAFDIALRINPHMAGVAQAAAELRRALRGGPLN